MKEIEKAMNMRLSDPRLNDPRLSSERLTRDGPVPFKAYEDDIDPELGNDVKAEDPEVLTC